MTLCKALTILAYAHTRDDDRVGYTVESYPHLQHCSQADYIAAWGEVRRAIGMQTDMAPFMGNTTIPPV